MSDAVLLVTAGIEIGLAVGYGMRWVHDVRCMVLGFAAALRRGAQ